MIYLQTTMYKLFTLFYSYKYIGKRLVMHRENISLNNSNWTFKHRVDTQLPQLGTGSTHLATRKTNHKSHSWNLHGVLILQIVTDTTSLVVFPRRSSRLLARQTKMVTLLSHAQAVLHKPYCHFTMKNKLTLYRVL